MNASLASNRKIELFQNLIHISIAISGSPDADRDSQPYEAAGNFLNQGQVIADGPTDDLMEDKQLLVAHGLERPY